MSKKNITLIVIAIVTLLTVVALATYAYFAGTVSITNKANVTASTEKNNMVFDTVGGAMLLNVTAANMQKSQVGLAAQNSTTLTVNFQANTSYSMACTYDIIYEWTSNAQNRYTTHSNNVTGNEFTIQATLASNSHVYEGTNSISSETDLSTAVGNQASATVVSGAQIDGTGSTTSTAVWTITSKFYNVNANQSSLANKSYQGRFKVANVSCVAGTVATQTPLISFTIDGNIYQAEEGMTWSEWVNSPYNLNNTFSLIKDTDGDPAVVGYNVSANVRPSDICGCSNGGVICLNNGYVNYIYGSNYNATNATDGSCTLLNNGPVASTSYSLMNTIWSFTELTGDSGAHGR